MNYKITNSILRATLLNIQDVSLNDGQPTVPINPNPGTTTQKILINLFNSHEDEEFGTVEGGGLFSPNSVCTLIANPKPGCWFEGWFDKEGNTISTSNPYSFVVTETQSIWGEIKTKQYNVIVKVASGDESKGYINWIQPAVTYFGGEELIVEAVPTDNIVWQFDKWSDGNTDNPRTIITQQMLPLYARFSQRDVSAYTLINGKSSKESLLGVFSLESFESPTLASGWKYAYIIPFLGCEFVKIESNDINISSISEVSNGYCVINFDTPTNILNDVTFNVVYQPKIQIIPIDYDSSRLFLNKLSDLDDSDATQFLETPMYGLVKDRDEHDDHLVFVKMKYEYSYDKLRNAAQIKIGSELKQYTQSNKELANYDYGRLIEMINTSSYENYVTNDKGIEGINAFISSVYLPELQKCADLVGKTIEEIVEESEGEIVIFPEITEENLEMYYDDLRKFITGWYDVNDIASVYKYTVVYDIPALNAYYYPVMVDYWRKANNWRSADNKYFYNECLVIPKDSTGFIDENTKVATRKGSEYLYFLHIKAVEENGNIVYKGVNGQETRALTQEEIEKYKTYAEFWNTYIQPQLFTNN